MSVLLGRRFAGGLSMITFDLLIRKDQLSTTELQPLTLGTVEPGRFVQIDLFALTSNNITYAAFGRRCTTGRFGEWSG
jgi:hypothetical protein